MKMKAALMIQIICFFFFRELVWLVKKKKIENYENVFDWTMLTNDVRNLSIYNTFITFYIPHF